jgi:ABC-type antimicrobial peptide transport system permease subunit
MFKNYLKTAFRNLWRNKTFSLINIFGLALGMACSLLIMLWVNDEYNVDSFHKNGTQLFSVYERQNHDGVISANHQSPGIMADEMKRVLPEVQYATNYAWDELVTFEANNKINKENGNYAGQDFFKMFTYPLLQGTAITALLSPTDIAVSKKMAEDFFGSPQKAIGKTIRYQNRKDLKITAVFDNVPINSSMQFDYIINWQTFLENNDWAKDWTNNGPKCYIMLHQGTNPKAFESKITRFLDNYNKEQTPNDYVRLGIQQYSDIYLHSNFKNGELSGGRIQYVQLFSIVAIFILLIACINFMNLTTARSVKRAKEIGVRKVVGAIRIALIKQFIWEALLIVMLSAIIALAIVLLALPSFNQLTGKQIILPVNNIIFWISIAGLLLVTGFISGSYPALYLSSFNPVRVLKGSLKFSQGALWFRKGLVVFQFMLSIILIVGTIVISKQVNYIQSTNLGYDRENLIYIPLEGDLTGKYELFKNQALSMPGIKEITRMSQNPTQIDNGTGGVVWDGKDPNSGVEFTQAAVGYDFTKTLHTQMAQGRDYSKDFATDSVGYIVNETALKIIGYKNPVGKPLTFWGKKGTIIGVIKDFHFNSLHTAINPLVLRLGEKEGWGEALVRTEQGKTKEALASLEKICKTLNPKFPFTYKFSDEEYANLYKSEQVVSKLSDYFAFLAIFISCLGLLGLVMFTAEQRTKEFGIRKVLGASPAMLFSLLSKEFLLLVLIAMLVACPVAWYAMNKWLEDYEYRVHITWNMFVIAGVLSVLIVLITVSFQAIKAAVANPVKSLRTE